MTPPNGTAPAAGTAARAGATLSISGFAHLKKVAVDFGDLTVLVGPQASGKSLVLQMLKLAVDGRVIARTMEEYGLVFKSPQQLLARYFGADMENAWREGKTEVVWEGRPVTLSSIPRHSRRGKASVYYVPAHRALTLLEGYPPTFQQFRPETPFVVRQFSEELRQVLITGPGQELLFPQAKRLKSRVREKIDEAVFHGGELREDVSGVQRQLKLRYGRDTSLSYMTWTAGQREFIPLLLGLYYLLPAGRYSKRAGTDWVVVEEPEMGLHPKGVMAIMLLIVDLLSRGYRVILSTHSTLVLDVVWALNVLKRNRAPWPPVLRLFGIEGVSKATARGEVEMAQLALRKSYRVYMFDIDTHAKVTSRDISSLDPASPDAAVSGWGGLTGMSGRISQVVSEIAQPQE